MVFRHDVDHERMRKLLEKEAKTLIGLSKVREVTSVFFGGGNFSLFYLSIMKVMDSFCYILMTLCAGTPSLALPSTIEAVIKAISVSTKLDPEAEISMEVNPTALESDRL